MQTSEDSCCKHLTQPLLMFTGSRLYTKDNVEKGLSRKYEKSDVFSFNVHMSKCIWILALKGVRVSPQI